MNEHRVEQHAFFDRSLLTLASGAIGISLPLVTYLTTQGPLEAKIALATAWVMLALSLTLNLVSYLTGARDAMREIVSIDTELRTGTDTSGASNPDRNITSVLNYMSLFMFCVGTFFLLTFAYINAMRG